MKENVEDFDLNEFEELQQSFETLISEVWTNEFVRENCEKMSQLVADSYKYNTILFEKYKKMQEALISNVQKVEGVLGSEQEDQKVIAKLRSEFENAWKTVEQMKEKEEKTESTVALLRLELDNLKELVEDPGIENEKTDNGKKTLCGEMKALKAEFEYINSEIKQKSDERERFLERIEELKEQSEQTQQDIYKEKMSTETLQGNQRELMEKMKDLKEIINESQSEVDGHSGHLDEYRNRMEDIRKAMRNCDRDRVFFTDETKLAGIRIEQLKKVLEKVLGVGQHVIENIGNVKERITSLIEGEQESITQDKKLKEAFEQAKLELEEVRSSRREIENQRKAVLTKLEAVRENVTRLRLQLVTSDAEVVSDKKEVSIKTKEQSSVKNEKDEERRKTDAENREKDRVEKEILVSRMESQNGREKMAIIAKDEKRYQDTSYVMHSNISQIQEFMGEIHQKNESELAHLKSIQREIDQQDVKNGNIQNQRDLYNRQLRVRADENNEGERKNERLESVLYQMKLDIRDMDRELVDTHIRLCDLVSICTTKEKEIAEWEEKVEALERKNIESENEVQVLVHHKEQAEKAKKQVEYENEILRQELRRAECDIGRKCREIDLVKQKCKCLEREMQMCAEKFDTRISEVARMESEFKNILEKHKKMIFQARRVDLHKKEAIRLERQLARTEIMSRALSDQTEVPLVISHSVLLESANPDLFRMLKMRQGLINDIYKRLGTIRNLVQMREGLKAQLAKLHKRLEASHGGRFREEYEILCDELQKKTTLLNQLKEKIVTQQLRDEKTKIESVRYQIREQKIESSETRYLNSEMRYSVMSPRSRSFSHRTARFSLGGGFTVGGLEMSEVPQPKLPSADTGRLRTRRATIAMPKSGRGKRSKLVSTPRTTRAIMSARIPTECM